MRCCTRSGITAVSAAWIIAVSLTLLSNMAWAGGDPPDFIQEWGSNGVGDGQFSGPHGIEVEADGNRNVYVVDTGNNRIQKFTGDGVFLTKWGSLGAAPGQFNHPHGIGIGPMGDVYVAETGNNRVQRFTSDGDFLTEWGSFGDGDGQFRHTHGLAVDSDGNVFVRLQAAAVVSTAWQELELELLKELLSEGFSRDQISLRQIAYIRYYGQLEDVEVESPIARLASEADLGKLLARHEEIFTKMYTLAGKPSDPTYHFTEVSVIAQVDTVKPKLLRHELQGTEPAKQASKGQRPVFQKGQWHDAQLFEMSELRPGNEINGLAVIEAPNTTLFVPQEWQVRIDEYEIYWLEKRHGNK